MLVTKVCSPCYKLVSYWLFCWLPFCFTTLFIIILFLEFLSSVRYCVCQNELMSDLLTAAVLHVTAASHTGCHSAEVSFCMGAEMSDHYQPATASPRATLHHRNYHWSCMTKCWRFWRDLGDNSPGIPQSYPRVLCSLWHFVTLLLINHIRTSLLLPPYPYSHIYICSVDYCWARAARTCIFTDKQHTWHSIFSLTSLTLRTVSYDY